MDFSKSCNEISSKISFPKIMERLSLNLPSVLPYASAFFIFSPALHESFAWTKGANHFIHLPDFFSDPSCQTLIIRACINISRP